MEKAAKERRAFLTVGITACITAVITTVLVPLFLLKSLYVVMGIMLALSVASIYLVSFAFFAAHEAALAVRIIPIFESIGELSGTARIEKTAEDIGWKTSATEKFLKKCQKRRYIIEAL